MRLVEVGHEMEDIQRALALGAVLKRIGNFDLSTFKGRLVLQKTVYLMQSYGLYFGYKFSWYVHGPYSPELTREAFKIYPFLNKIPGAKFAKPQTEKRFQDFLCFVGEKKSDPDWLEQLACIDFLSSLNPDANKEAILKAVLNHETHFSKRQCEEAWNHLVKNDLIKEKKE
jgi:uncharacterized protein YwgA